MSYQGKSVWMPPVVRKVVWTLVIGFAAYLITDLALEDQAEQLLITVFVGGVTLVVQYLSNFDRDMDSFSGRLDKVERRLADHADEMSSVVGQGFEKINDATQLFGLVEKSALRTDEVVQLVRNATRIHESPPLVFELAEAEIGRTSKFLRELRNGDATYDGEDRDWLLALTGHVHHTIDATSTMTVDAGGVDFDGGFWFNDLGRHYLQRQADAIRRREVRVRRIFLLKTPELLDNKTFQTVYEEQKDIGVDVRVLTADQVPAITRNDLVDFILFDNVISYETTPATPVDPISRPTIAKTTLEMRAEFVDRKVQIYQELWKAAKELPGAEPAAPAAPPGPPAAEPAPGPAGRRLGVRRLGGG